MTKRTYRDYRSLADITPEQIKEYRKRHRLTQRELAKLAGISESRVRKVWETKGFTANQIKEAQAIVMLAASI